MVNPAAGQPAPLAPLPVRRSGPNWWLIGGLGCSGLVLLFIVIPLATLFITFVLGAKQGGAAVPSDFPAYPGAHLLMAIGNPDVGTTAVWTTNAPIDLVDAFYRDRLSQPPWVVMGPASTGRGWRFQRTDGQRVRGEVRVVERTSETAIEMVLVRVSSSG